MEKYSFDEISQIYLFRSNSEINFSAPALNEFLSYLKYQRIMNPYKFSFVGTDGNLIPELTLKQNLLLDYSGDSLSEEKDIQFKKALHTQPNLQLETLYQMIVNLGDIPANSTAEEVKIISLLKPLLSDAPFIFLECPEADLSDNSFKIFQEALFNQIQITKQNVFIITKNEKNWFKYVTKIISRNKNFSFKTEDVEEKPNFNEQKKKFYEYAKEEKANQSILKFHRPIKKKAA